MTARTLLACLCLAAGARAQTPDTTTAAPAWTVEPPLAPALVDTAEAWRAGWGVRVRVSESGFGLGAYAARRLSPDWAAVATLHLSNVTDERESKFFGLGGTTTIPEKLNYLLVLPLQVGAQHRLFRRRIASNFRPFVTLTAGPTLAWRSPYFDDCTGDDEVTPGATCNERPEGERTFSALESLPRGTPLAGVGGELALGADFGEGRRVQGVRIGVALDYFPTAVRLLEADARPDAQTTFASPFVVLSFGRRAR